MGRVWLSGFLASLVPGLYWAFLGLLGVAETDGFLADVIFHSGLAVPTTLFLFVPIFLWFSRKFRPQLGAVLLLSVAFWAAFQFSAHVLAAYRYGNLRLLAVSFSGIVIYVFLGIAFGLVFWFLTNGKPRT